MAKFYENMRISNVCLIIDWDGKNESHWFEISLEPITDNNFQTVLVTVKYDPLYEHFFQFMKDHGWDPYYRFEKLLQVGNRRERL